MKTLLMGLVLVYCSNATTVLRMTCGGNGGTDAAGNVWVADTNFTGGARWSSANQANMSTLPLEYQTLRYSANPPGSPFSYSIPLPIATYTLTLKFAEPNKTAAGQRVFTVNVNGTDVIVNLDLFAKVGLLKTYDVSLPVTAVNGKINILFTPQTASMNATVSAIQVDSVDAPPLPHTLKFPCEVSIGGLNAGWSLSLFSGVYQLWGCWNLSGVNYHITSLRCASDAAGSVLEVTIPDYSSTATPLPLKSIGAVPCNVPPEQVQSIAVDATYPAGDFLRVFLRVADAPPGSTTTASQIVAVIGIEYDSTDAMPPTTLKAGERVLGKGRLVALDVCSGRGGAVLIPPDSTNPAWDCANLLRIHAVSPGGVPMEIYGTTLPSPINNPALTWSPVK